MIYLLNVDFGPFWQKWVPPKWLNVIFDYKIMFNIEKDQYNRYK